MPTFGTDGVAGLILRIRSDSKDAKADIAQVRAGIAGLASSVGAQMPGATTGIEQFGKALTLLKTPAGAAVLAIAGLGAAALAATVVMFKFSKVAAEYGDEIYDAAQKTGVGTDELQAFKVAAEQSGSELGNMEASLTKFTVLLGKASTGNDEAQATLAKYKITALDVNAALAQSIERLGQMKTVEEQNAAAMELFKDRGGNVINVLREMNFDLKASVETLKQQGTLMAGEEVNAAGEYADALDTLNKQLKFIGITIGSAVIPQFLRMAKEFSGWLSKNKDEIKSWAKYFSDTMMKTILQIRVELNDLNNLYSLILGKQAQARIASQFTVVDPYSLPQGAPIRQLAEDAAKEKKRLQEDARRLAKLNSGQVEIISQADQTPIDYSRPGMFKAEDADVKKARDEAEKERKKAAEKREEERQKALSIDAQAAVDLLKIQLDESLKEYQKYYDDLAELVKKGALTRDQAIIEGNKYSKEVGEERNKLLAQYFDAQKKSYLEDEKRRSQMKVLDAEQEAYKKNENAQRAEAINKFNKEAQAAEAKANDKRLDDIRANIEQEIKIRELASETVVKRAETDYAMGKTSNDKVIRARVVSESDFLKFKLGKLEEELKAFKGNAEEERRINAEIAETREKQEQNRIQAETDIFLLEKNNAEELAELKREVVLAERELLDARAATIRQELERKLTKTVGPQERIKVLEEIRDLDIKEAERQKKQREEDLALEEAAEKKRIKGKENEEEQKFQIEELYRKRRLMSEEQFQKDLKAIKDGFVEDTDPFAGVKDSWNRLKDAMMNSADMDSAMNTLGESLLEMVNNLKDALESAIESWILYGDSIGAAMKKALAAELAKLAASSAIHALEATAWGFYMLAMQDYRGAALAFQSAALFAAVAIGAGVAARALTPGGRDKAGTTASKGGAGTTSAGGANETRPDFENPSVFRHEEGEADSGRRYGNPIADMMAQMMDKMNTTLDKFEPMKKGDVLVGAAKEQPGFIGQQAAKDIQRDPSTGIALRRTMIGG
jgi:hypothetical protein